jgi:hypothetical protein
MTSVYMSHHTARIHSTNAAPESRGACKRKRTHIRQANMTLALVGSGCGAVRAFYRLFDATTLCSMHLLTVYSTCSRTTRQKQRAHCLTNINTNEAETFQNTRRYFPSQVVDATSRGCSASRCDRAELHKTMQQKAQTYQPVNATYWGPCVPSPELAIAVVRCTLSEGTKC